MEKILELIITILIVSLLLMILWNWLITDMLELPVISYLDAVILYLIGWVSRAKFTI